MSSIDYGVILSEEEVINRIDLIDKIAQSYMMKINISSLVSEDLFFFSAIDKSIKMIESFIFALKNRNVTVLSTLTRLQIDCTIRAFSSSLVDDSSKFCYDVIVNGRRIDKIKDRNGKLMKDCYLCEQLSKKIGFPVYEIYQKTCSYVHFSSRSLFDISKTDGDNGFNFYISRNNREDQQEAFARLSLELASCFLYFAMLLVEDIFGLWVIQKNQMYPKD